MKKTILIGLAALLVFSFSSVNAVQAQKTTTNAQTAKKAKIKAVKKVKIGLVKKKTKKKTVYTTQKVSFNLNGTNGLVSKKIKYKSSNKAVVKINKKGKVKLLKKGKAKITIVLTAKKGIIPVKQKFTCSLNVKIGVKSIVVPAEAKNAYYIGKKYQLTPTVLPVNHNESIKWVSSDPEIASVSDTGLLSVVKEGNVYVTAYSNKTKKKYNLLVNAQQKPSLSFNDKKEIEAEYGKTIQLHPVITNVDKSKVVLESLDTTIATVTSTGLVKIIRPGTVYIVLRTKDKSLVAQVKIVAPIKKGFVTEKLLKSYGADDCDKLMIVAHPDDESLWGGAHLKEGKWFVVCMTNNYTQSRKIEYYRMLVLAGQKGMMLDYPDMYYIYNKNLKKEWQKDDWSHVYDAATEDIRTLITYKNWDQIATHSPTGETSHIHHLKIDAAVTKECKNYNIFDKLWYFGKFYTKGNIPVDLPRLSDEEIAFKQRLIDVYQGEATPIATYWDQMIPYENWEKATEYVQQ